MPVLGHVGAPPCCFIQLTEAAEAALEWEYRHSDAPLLNILPAFVAGRLKQGDRICDG
jgi:hypothetical protein